MGERAQGAVVVVVGGGPAGSATAVRLARAGHRVLLLDRDPFPRPKPCGECLSPAAVRALAALGVLDRVLAAPHRELRGWRVHASATAAFTGAFGAGERGLGVARDRLDALLLEYARESGVEVRTGARVADLLRRDGRVAGVRLADGEEVPAPLVVGADGLRSLVVRRAGLLRRGPRLRKLALTAHVRGVSRLGGFGELHVFPWGCVGVAGVDADTANVTLVVSGREGARVAGARADYFDRALRGLDRLAGSERTGEVMATGPFDWPTRAVVADGVLLVGDAAGYYDPFTGQGIFRALRGAELAAAAADRALRAGDCSAAALAPYARAHASTFAAGVRLQRAIEGVVSRPRLLRLAVDRLRQRPEVADRLIAVTGDMAPVRSLLSPRVLAGLVT